MHQFQTTKNESCSVIVFHLLLLQRTFPEFVGMFATMFSALVVLAEKMRLF